jgi:hypothetical protein
MPVSLLTDSAATSPASPSPAAPGERGERGERGEPGDIGEPCVNPSAARPLVRSEGSDVRLDSA